MKKYVCAIDQGTTSTRFMIFDKSGDVVAFDQMEHRQIYPYSGWVEHDPLEIIEKTLKVIIGGLAKSGIEISEISGIGITNQRETSVLWDKTTGKPYYNAIVWQDVRTDDMCRELNRTYGERIREKTGLPVNTYFSASKIKWIIDNIPQVKKDLDKGKVLFGNIDSWLIWKLTGGPGRGVHVTDVSNASRTQLMNIKTLEWDKELLDIFGIPLEILPQIRASSDFYGCTTVLLEDIPICGDLGDQQAALFGQTCFESGEVKNTYGTGCFMLMNTGNTPIISNNGLLTTIGYKIGKSAPVYCLEGSIAIAGALVQWLRDNLGIIESSSGIQEFAGQVEDNGGVYFVPAFSGLFAPYWQSKARGTIVGLTRFVNKHHIARAALEATAFQTKDVINAMEKDSKVPLKSLKVDGGMVNNDLLMQFQADIMNVPVIKPKVTETTALGAAYAAGLASGFYESINELKANWKKGKEYLPSMDSMMREKLYKNWKKAIEKSMDWVD